MRGLKRGFILQALHMISFIAAFIVAVLYYDKIAVKLPLWIPYPDMNEGGFWGNLHQVVPMETAFYNAISFIIIFLAVKILLQILSSMLDFVAQLPILNSVNRLAGAVLGFLEVYVVLFLLLYILTLAPLEQIQTYLNGSSLVHWMLENTPYLSEKMKELWFTDLASMVQNSGFFK